MCIINFDTIRKELAIYPRMVLVWDGTLFRILEKGIKYKAYILLCHLNSFIFKVKICIKSLISVLDKLK